jgi:hypothetical protein
MLAAVNAISCCRSRPVLLAIDTPFRPSGGAEAEALLG